MKKALNFVVASVIAAACILAAGCANKETLILNKYNAPLDMHTEAQRSFLYDTDNPADMDKEIKGLEELSRPAPITLKWSDKGGNGGNYAVEISENADLSDSVLYFSDTTQVEVYNLKLATKYFWRVRNNISGGAKSAIGEFATSDYGPRNMYVDGVTNVRDVGGWVTASGERTVQGVMYRGGRLNNSYSQGYDMNAKPTTDRDKDCEYEREITDAGIKAFTNVMKIKTEIDLRELHANGFPRDEEGNEIYQSNVQGVNYIAIPMKGSADINENFEPIKQLFEVLSNKDNYPVYFHCNIGTDRTGMVAYILGALCGLDEDTLYRDYLFSNFGTISLASMAWNGKVRSRKELIDLTGSEDKGAAYRFASYLGETLQEKAEYCLKELCGVPENHYETVKNIMLGKA